MVGRYCDVHSELLQLVLEALLTLLKILRTRRAGHDKDLLGPLSLRGFSVQNRRIGAERSVIRAVVSNALALGAVAIGHENFDARVDGVVYGLARGRTETRDDQHVDLLRDEVLDHRDLFGDVAGLRAGGLIVDAKLVGLGADLRIDFRRPPCRGKLENVADDWFLAFSLCRMRQDRGRDASQKQSAYCKSKD